jgi:uncharacterized protein YjdB
VSPADATNKTVTWSIINGTGQATISATGLVTAVANGTVTARATANDGSGIFGEIAITIANQVIMVTGITVTGEGGATSVDLEHGTLQMIATIVPSYATVTDVSWLVINGTGQATISETGLLTPVSPGEVIVMATAVDGSGVTGESAVTIRLVSSIEITHNRYQIIVKVPDNLMPAKASLHNLRGAHIQTKNITTTECTFDISGLLPGIYVVSVYNSEVRDAAKIAVSY